MCFYDFIQVFLYNTGRMNGVILLNKPTGMTSFEAIRKCRNILHEKKAGHSGTLDPNASGLMILFFGRYTKLVPYCVSDHKHYIATFQTGIRTDTQDIWGKVLDQKETQAHDQKKLDLIAAKMTGDQEQIPPMYSAIKKNGRKLYEYARKGIEVERKPRKIHISSLRVVNTGENTYSMDAVVSSGTYIRTLIEDYCTAMNEYGCMTSLVREGIENLHLKDACTFTDVEEGKGFIDPLQVIDPEWKIRETDDLFSVENGRKIKSEGNDQKVIFTHAGRILAAYEKQPDGYYHCVRGLQ